MKKLFTILTLVFFSSIVYAEPEVKKICHDKVVKGKKTQVCKNVKMHKKLATLTKIPPKPVKPSKPAPKPTRPKKAPGEK